MWKKIRDIAIGAVFTLLVTMFINGFSGYFDGKTTDMLTQHDAKEVVRRIEIIERDIDNMQHKQESILIKLTKVETMLQIIGNNVADAAKHGKRNHNISAKAGEGGLNG